MEFIRRIQLNLMLVLIGVCGILTVMAICTRTLSRRRRYALVTLELSGMLLLVFDRLAYLYRGDVSSLGLILTRVSNFFVFLLPVVMLHAVNLYLIDLVRTDGGLPPGTEAADRRRSTVPCQPDPVSHFAVHRSFLHL